MTTVSLGIRRQDGRRVLIVDDSIDSAESMAVLLDMEGYKVTCAHNGPAALEIAGRELPDVVLLDVGLPGIDGFEVARRMRSLAAGAALRIIALSGYGRESDRAAALHAGMDDYLLKPVDPARIFATIESLDRADTSPDPSTR